MKVVNASVVDVSGGMNFSMPVPLPLLLSIIPLFTPLMND
jgi:hypothetical protein